EARAPIEKAIALEPDSVDARVNLAALLSEQRNYIEARRVPQETLALAPDDEGLKRRLQQVEEQLGVQSSATAAPAVAPAPAAEPQFQLGRMLFLCGRPSEAASALEQARILAPQDDRARRLLERIDSDQLSAP